MGLRAGLDWGGKSRPTGIRSPDCPARRQSMSLGTDTNYLEVDNGDSITSYTEYKCLRSIFTEDGRDTKNIRHRVTQAQKIISAQNWIWWSKDITKNWKKMI